MTEQELVEIETRWQEHQRACLSQQGCCGSVDDVPHLLAEVRRLQAQVADDSKFIAELQSELLSKRAEQSCEVCGKPFVEGQFVCRSSAGIRHHMGCDVRPADPDHVVADVGPLTPAEFTGEQRFTALATEAAVFEGFKLDVDRMAQKARDRYTAWCLAHAEALAGPPPESAAPDHVVGD